MIVKVRQASNGGVQVCIPREIQEALSISKGEYVKIELDGKVIKVEPIK